MSRHPIKPCGVTYPHLAHVGTHGDAATGRFARCPGVAIDPATRAQPVKRRRLVLDELRRIKRVAEYLINQWDAAGMLYVDTGERPRRIDEFPENDPAAWRTLARRADELARDWQNVADYARLRGIEVDEFRADRAEAARRVGAVEL